MRDLNVIIFSKDRAAQLDLLLRSMRRFFSFGPHVDCRVLYRASDPAFATGYDMVRRKHGSFAGFVRQRDFREDVLSLLNDRRFTMFLVDDDVFIAPFSLDAGAVSVFSQDDRIATLSLRMHPGVSFCYTRQVPTPAPAIEPGCQLPRLLCGETLVACGVVEGPASQEVAAAATTGCPK